MIELPNFGETGTCRERLAKFCIGNGLDIGFGGVPMVAHAICLDREEGHPHRAVFPDIWPTHLVGDATNLHWFKDGVLDWVASSHTLEDFEDTAGVLAEWCRVLKPGGNLVLFLPDQKTYVQHCASVNSLPNQAHKHAHFSLDYVKSCLPTNMRVIYEMWPVPNNPYSFDLVAQKQTV